MSFPVARDGVLYTAGYKCCIGPCTGLHSVLSKFRESFTVNGRTLSTEFGLLEAIVFLEH